MNAAGVTRATYEYDAWGNLINMTYTNAALANANPLRYRGYVYDAETGLYYLQSRYYDPEMGRFINADAFASTGQGFVGNNMFAYCNNNPVIYCDPDGEVLKHLLPKAYDTINFLFDKINNISGAFVSSIEVQVSFGTGFGAEMNRFGLGYYRDLYLGVDDSQFVMGNKSSYTVADYNVTYDHRTHCGGKDLPCKQCRCGDTERIFESCNTAKKTTSIEKTIRLPGVPVFNVSSNNNSDCIISMSASAHLIIGATASVSFSFSEFIERLFD